MAQSAHRKSPSTISTMSITSRDKDGVVEAKSASHQTPIPAIVTSSVPSPTLATTIKRYPDTTDTPNNERSQEMADHLACNRDPSLPPVTILNPQSTPLSTIPSSSSSSSLSSSSSSSSSSRPPLMEMKYSATQDHSLSMHSILAFCFPASLQHPASAGRLSVLAYHGPPSHSHSYLVCLCSPCQQLIRDSRTTHGNTYKEDSDMDRHGVQGGIGVEWNGMDWIAIEFAKRLFSGVHFTEDDLDKVPAPGLCDKCTGHARTAVHIRGGFRGQQIVNERQLDEMAKAEEISQILDAYDRQHQLSREEEARFIASIDKQKIATRNFTKDEVRALFADLPRDDKGKMNFYQFREVVDRLRVERVGGLRKMFPDVVVKRDSLLASITPPPPEPLRADALARGLVDPNDVNRLRAAKVADREMRAARDARDGDRGGHRRQRSLTSVFPSPSSSNAISSSSSINQNTGHSFVRSAPLPSLTRTMAAKKKIPSHQAFTVTHRLISRYAHTIADMSQKNNVDLALNVRLMRNEY